MAAATARVRLRRRRLLAVAALAVALSTSSVGWLATSGVVTLSVAAGAPPSGTINGRTADLVPLNPSNVTVPAERGGQVVSGLALGAVKVAAGYGSGSKLDIAWLDPQDAGKVLNNPNAWLSFGLYYPIHTGSCTGGDPDGAVTISVDSLCAALDTSASGKLVDDGQLIISKSVLSGFLRVGASDPTGGSSPCGSSGSSWCTPSSLSSTSLGASQNVLYVVVSINTPGDTPSGQQSQAGTLSFFMDVRSV